MSDTIDKGRVGEVIESCVDHLAAGGRGLSDWEKEFIESINDQFGRHGKLSERQTEILERIYLRI